MITDRSPDTWQGLQVEVAAVLTQCGFEAAVEETIETVRGRVTADVLAREDVLGRENRIVCECKHWKNRVPQTVVHSFRTVLADFGANAGYIISSSGFQVGAFNAVELTNVRLVTWPEFQAEFEGTWLEKFLLPTVADRFDSLFSLTEPLLPKRVFDLDDADKDRFMSVRERYFDFGMIMMLFTPYMNVVKLSIPSLPLRGRFRPTREETEMPDAFLDAIGYRDLLDIATPFAESAVAELSAALGPSD